MSYYGQDGGLYETCPECGLTVEVDSHQDGKQWGINHWDAYHTAPEYIRNMNEEELRHHLLDCTTHNIRNCTICIPMEPSETT
jgi:hypothetical protein